MRFAPPLALLLLLGSFSCLSAAPQPNLVIILTDDQDLMLGSLDFMPRTRALIADQGITFENHFVPLSLCCPSRSTILTGLHVHNHRVLTNFPPDGGFERFDQLKHEDRTLAVALHDAGYRTALFGKYLNGYPNGEALTYVPPGWDEWASPVKGSPYAAYRYTLNENGRLVVHGSKAEDYMTDVLAAKAVSFVRKSGNQPFFLYLATYAPHRPSTPAKRHAGLFPGLQAPRTPSFNEPDVRDKPARIRALKRLDASRIAAIDALYRKQMQSLQAVDEAVAALVEALRDTGRLDNTCVVFTSDNGFHMGQHRLEPGKYTPYEPDVHVPLLVRGPNVPRGLLVDALTLSVDFAPTFAELAGATLPAQPDGRSLVPFLKGTPPASWRQAILLEQFAVPPAPPKGSDLQEPGDDASYPSHRGIRTATYKYVQYGTGEKEVYDLRKDPDERLNLRDQVSKAWLDSVAKLVKALASCKGASCREIEARTVPALP
ncbi:MAG TPA: sulfatase-like hydrolase/transferase [Thermoanaerobaculia bacterium]|nr:sulfatase-like hydrolase/transferase [Thermoanaerobaculia bacterium]